MGIGDRLDHDRRQVLGPELKTLLEREVSGAVGEGVQSRELDVSLVEHVHHRIEQPVSDAAVPEVGAYRQRTSESETTPTCREHRTDHL